MHTGQPTPACGSSHTSVSPYPPAAPCAHPSAHVCPRLLTCTRVSPRLPAAPHTHTRQPTPTRSSSHAHPSAQAHLRLLAHTRQPTSARGSSHSHASAHTRLRLLTRTRLSPRPRVAPRQAVGTFRASSVPSCDPKVLPMLGMEQTPEFPRGGAIGHCPSCHRFKGHSPSTAEPAPGPTQTLVLGAWGGSGCCWGGWCQELSRG